ncbi:MAG: hypothetical protein U1E42_13545 [Rhodospirillales bacterium]
MTAMALQIGNLPLDDSQRPALLANDPRPETHRPGPVGAREGDPLTHLGRLLHGHTWEDSRHWARALEQLSQLSEDDLVCVLAAAVEQPARPDA